MTDAEIKNAVIAIQGCSQDDASVYLSLAKSKVLDRLYPWLSDRSIEPLNVPSCYDGLLIELTVRLLQRQGTEGEHTHREEGTDRIYFTSDDDDLLCRVTPFARIM